MKTYLITYDLVGNDETSDDYKRLIEHIKTHSKWGKVAKSVWVVRTSLSAKQIRDDLDIYTDSNDRILVAKLSGEGAWRNTICSNEWLKDNLNAAVAA